MTRMYIRVYVQNTRENAPVRGEIFESDTVAWLGKKRASEAALLIGINVIDLY
jgi:hypothetical protein